MNKIVLASGNKGKLRELQSMLEGLDMQVVAQSDYFVPGVEETGTTFVENAIIKARHACAHTGLPAVADDSGLEVDALDGAPGVYSARFAGEDANDADNNRKLLDELCDIDPPHRTARYHAVIVCMRHERDPTPLICAGSWEGEIAENPQGEGGFGYDPLFWLADRGCTAAELDPAEKNRLSHRGKAMAQLKAQLAEFLARKVDERI